MENRGRYLENYFEDDLNSKLLSLSDGTLRTEDGRRFRIHKYMLAMSSKYFCALFCGMAASGDSEDVLIRGVKGETLSNILSYIYTDAIHVTEDNICDLIVVSDYLLLDGLFSILESALKTNLTIDNCLQIFTSVLLIHSEGMLRESFRFIQTNFESVLFDRDCKIGDLPLETLKMLLCDRNLRVRSERIVWLSILKWVDGDRRSRLAHVPDLLMYLTPADVDEAIAIEILEHDTVARNKFCEDIYEAKTLLSLDDLAALQCYFRSRTKPLLTFYEHRRPVKFHYVAFYRTRNGTDGIEMYLTYDENLDVWRKLFEADVSPEFILSHDETLYLFRSQDSRNWRYDVMAKQWTELPAFRVQRYNYSVVQLDGVVYILGGLSEESDEEVYDVEYFNSAMNVWYFTTPMTPVSSFSAVALNGFIFVVGSWLDFFEYEMIAQMYYPPTQAWNMLPSPPMTRSHFAMIAYHERIYVIGGYDSDGQLAKDVEAFDPAVNEWSREADLPRAYYVPRAIVFNDTLVVYDNHLVDREYLETNPPIYWNTLQNRWELLENPSLVKNLHRHYVLTVELVNALWNENRDPVTRFEKSHFR